MRPEPPPAGRFRRNRREARDDAIRRECRVHRILRNIGPTNPWRRPRWIVKDCDRRCPCRAAERGNGINIRGRFEDPPRLWRSGPQSKPPLIKALRSVESDQPGLGAAVVLFAGEVVACAWKQPQCERTHLFFI